MNLSNATVVSFNRRTQYLGENASLKSVVELSVQCAAVGTNFGTIHGIINGIANSAGTTQFREDISINGTSFGKGYVSSVTASPDGTDTQMKMYTVNVSIEYAGNLSKIFSTVGDSSLLQSFSDSYNFSREGVKENYTQECNLQINPDDRANGLNIGKGIVSAVAADTTRLQSMLGFPPTLGGCKKFNEENYDQKSNTYSFKSSWQIYKNTDSSPSTLVSYSTSGQFNEDGTITVTVKVDVIGNSGDTAQQRANEAKAKVESLKSSLFAKASSLYSQIKNSISGIHNSLQDYPTTETTDVAISEGRASSSRTYTNSLEIYASDKVYWQYSNSVTNEELSSIISEEGTIFGGGPLNDAKTSLNSPTQKYNSAKSKFNSIKGEIKQRAKNLWDNTGSGDFKLVSYSISHGYNAGSIKYNYRYSNNPALKFGDEDVTTPIRKKHSDTSYDVNVNLSSNFLLFGQDMYELLQRQPNIMPKKKITRESMNGLGTLKMGDYITQSTVPSLGGNSVIESITFQFSIKNREFTSEYNILEIVDK
ncbi:MAG: hypothetical protein RL736_262 [Pseudomonadota bacterium]|jgi:hypothetical protein